MSGQGEGLGGAPATQDAQRCAFHWAMRQPFSVTNPVSEEAWNSLVAKQRQRHEESRAAALMAGLVLGPPRLVPGNANGFGRAAEWHSDILDSAPEGSGEGV